MSMEVLEAVLVDDEAPARALLRDLLSDYPQVRVVGEASSVAEATEVIRRLRPGILFLDIRLGRGNGFELLSQLPLPPPRVVFVSAFGQYAVRAFDNDAVDYLLKPLDPARLRRTVERLHATNSVPDLAKLVSTLQSLVGSLPARDTQARAAGNAPASARPRFVAREDERFVVVDVPQVSLIEADKNYVWFSIGAKRIRARYSINDVEASLDPGEFLRLNRSTIVQAAQIQSFERNFRGRLLVILKSGRRLVCTAGYRERVLRYLGVS